MKIYIVTASDDDGVWVDAVYSSWEKAHHHIADEQAKDKKRRADKRDNLVFDVSEWEVEE